MGVCAQVDLLWDELTVLEHLRFVSEIKGLAQEQSKAQIDFLLLNLELEHEVDK